MTSLAPSDRRLARALFAAFTFFYLLGLGGHIYTPDGTIMFGVARRVAFEGRLEAQPIPGWEDFGGVWVVDSSGASRFYSKYGIGTSLGAVPLLWLGRALLPLACEGERGLFAGDPRYFEFETDSSLTLVSPRGIYYPVDRTHFDAAFLAFVATWLSALVAAGTVAGLFCTGRALGYSPGASLTVAAVLSVASPLWHYSKEFFSEPLGALGVTWFVCFMVRASRGGRARDWALSATMMGVAILAKPAHAILLLPAVVPLGWHWSQLGRDTASRAVGFFLLGLAGATSIGAAYNVARFGSPLETGYGNELLEWTTPLWEGVRGLLVSPGRGLFLYAPATILGVVTLPRFAARAPTIAAFVALSLLAFVLFYARWYMWEGGWCWGPRFLIPILPLLLLPLLCLFEEPPKNRIARAIVATILGLSFVVACSGVIVGYHEYCRWLTFEFASNRARYEAMGLTHYYDMMRWKWAFSPLLQYWVFPIKDYFLLPHALRNPGLVLALFAAWGVGLAVSLVVLVRCARSAGLSGSPGDPAATGGPRTDASRASPPPRRGEVAKGEWSDGKG